jgi:YesN/AraC family two-component response regulator
MTSIVLADDHHIVRQGLRALLDAETDLTVVGEAADGLEALSLVEELAPNVLIIDLMMPKLNGMEVVKKVSQSWASTRTCATVSLDMSLKIVFWRNWCGRFMKSLKGGVI